MATPKTPATISPSVSMTGMNDDSIPLRSFSNTFRECKRLTVSEAVTFVLSQFVDVKGIPNCDVDGWHRDYGFVLIGEAGVSKTTSIRHAARVNELDFALLEFAGVELADNLPINLMEEDPENPGQFRKLSNGPLFRRPASPTGRGIALINEALGADPRQQQQIRSLISNRQISGVPIHPGWTFVLDSNPATNQYFTNRQFDYSLEHRLFCIPIRRDYSAAMARWGTGVAGAEVPRLPKPQDVKKVEVTPWGMHHRIFDFLRINEQYFACGCDRRWDLFSVAYSRMIASGIVNETLLSHFVSLAWPEAVSNTFKESLARGTGQAFWPIQADKLLGASAKEMDELKDTLLKWKSDPTTNSMIGFTLLNVIDYIGKPVCNLNTDSLKNLGIFASILTEQQLHQLVNAPGSQVNDNSEKLWVELRKHPGIIERCHDSLKAADQTISQAEAIKSRKKLTK